MRRRSNERCAGQSLDYPKLRSASLTHHQRLTPTSDRHYLVLNKRCDMSVHHERACINSRFTVLLLTCVLIHGIYVYTWFYYGLLYCYNSRGHTDQRDGKKGGGIPAVFVAGMIARWSVRYHVPFYHTWYERSVTIATDLKPIKIAEKCISLGAE